MVKRLIFVHGINNQNRTKTDIEDAWSDALRHSMRSSANSWWNDVQIQTAYYADVLFEAEQEWGESQNSVLPMSANSLDEDFASPEIASLFIEMQRSFGITDDEVRKYLDEGGIEAPVERMGRGIHKRWLKAIARALEDVIPNAAPGAARLFLSQAAAYLHKPALFDQINSLVREQVFLPGESHENTVVVSHSLGTIISYVLLRGLMGTKTIPLFVTLGSPLGVKIVKDRVGIPLVTPPVVGRWINGSDREDFVALYPELTRDNFGPANLVNYSNLDNGHDDPHDITRYLAHPEIAKEIERALAG